MKYLLPITAVTTGLIAYAVYRSKRKTEWIPLDVKRMIPDNYSLGRHGHGHKNSISLTSISNDEVGY